MSFQINKRERMKVCVSSSEEELRNTTVEELKRKLIPEDQHDNTILVYHYYTTLKKNHTLGSYGIKHEDEIIAVRRGTSITLKIELESSHGQVTEETLTFEDDDDEDTEMSRTQSIEHLALMQQIEHHSVT